MQEIAIVSDWHTHTRYSDGSGAVEDNVRAAAEMGLKEVAITDHGPRGLFIGVKSEYDYLKIKEEIKSFQENSGVRILLGAEANIIDPDGSIDIPPGIVKELDILLAGLHPQVIAKSVGDTAGWIFPNLLSKAYKSLREKMRGINTRAVVNAMYSNPISVITHPDLIMPVDLNEVARASAGTNCAVEINSRHDYNKDEVIKAAMEWKAPVVVNSDAHSPGSVGRLESGIALLNKWNVPVSMVKNVKEIPGEHLTGTSSALKYRINRG
ncbi:MAG: PHP domain-containing protein [Clostridiales bacterium]|nr:PHP domain-containing protein [Clostridiales bacterium]MCF8021637.1 PHP domain-containing protein [Clostridiales bacterium]